MPDPLATPVGISLHHPNLLEREVQPLVEDLAVRGVVPLSVRHRPDEEGHRSVPVDEEVRPLAQARPSAAAFDVVGDAETPQPAPRLCLRPSHGEARHVGAFEGALENRVEFARVVEEPGRGLVRKGVGGNQVPAAELDRLESDLLGRRVHQPFHDVESLRSPRSPVGIRRHGVGEAGRDVGVGGGDAVGIGGHQGGEGRRDGAPRGGVGAEVREVPHPKAHDAVVRIEGEFGVAHEVAPVGVAEERLRAVRDPLDGPAEVPGREGAEDVLRIERVLAPESAPDVVHEHPEPVFLLDSEDLRELALHAVRHLGRDVQGPAAVLVCPRPPRAPRGGRAGRGC